MDEWKDIPMPTEAEKERSVGCILDRAALKRRGFSWVLRSIPFWTLFFGVEDCIFLGVLTAVLCLFPAVLASPNAPLGPLLFLASPAFYAFLQLFVVWKEKNAGILEWRKTCYVSLNGANALRMLVFGGVSVLVCVPVDLAMWLLSEKPISLPWMFGVSLSGLFLYGALSLINQGLRFTFLMPFLWTAGGVVLLGWDRADKFFLQIPAYAFFLAAVGGLGIYLLELRHQVLQYGGEKERDNYVVG